MNWFVWVLEIKKCIKTCRWLNVPQFYTNFSSISGGSVHMSSMENICNAFWHTTWLNQWQWTMIRSGRLQNYYLDSYLCYENSSYFLICAILSAQVTLQLSINSWLNTLFEILERSGYKRCIRMFQCQRGNPKHTGIEYIATYTT